jgi:excinuclease ABC subunit C
MLTPPPNPDAGVSATAHAEADNGASPCLIPLTDLRARLRLVPTQPGVYLMRDGQGRILYVGKASVLRNRLRSYFQKQDDLGIKVQHLVARIAAFDWIVTATEQEALILENNLLKEHHPRYNIKLRDDKQYLYLRITMGQRFPRVGTVRRTAHDDSRYFGPYTDSTALRETIKHLQRLFLFRTCTLDMERTYPRACLLFHIKRCSAPCIRAIEEEPYRDSVKHLLDFLDGRGKAAIDALRASMAEAAESLQFERAAALRDRVRSAEQIVEKQRITSVGRGDLDAIAFATDGDDVVVQVFTVRDDNVVGREEFVLQDAGGASPEEVGAQFVQQYYARATFIPPRVLLPVMPPDDKTLRTWLTERRGGAVRLEVPQRGPKRDLLELVTRNAGLALERLRTEWLADRRRTSGALRELAEALHMPEPPRRIECYDISHVQGTSTVASMVVFEDGKPATHAYRRFRIRAGDQNDDFKSMHEVIARRFRRAVAATTTSAVAATAVTTLAVGSSDASAVLDEGEVAEDAGEAGLMALEDEHTPDDAVEDPNDTAGDATVAPDTKGWANWPDLVIIDGGKGQLGAALDALAEVGVDTGPGGLSIVGLAKQFEEIFRPGHSQPVLLPRNSQALYLVQRVRDEAHRFAVAFHQQVRAKRQVGSRLDHVDGIGPKRKKALMLRFGSLTGIRAASDEELLSVPGISRAIVAQLREQL